MRYVTFVLLLMLSPLSFAADLTATVPAAAVTEASAQCDRQRVILQVRPADWNNDVCATIMVKLGIRASLFDEHKALRQALITTAADTGNNNAQSDLNDFDANFPLPVTPAACGDSTVDAEFGEACDDGGESATCDVDCTGVVCGDDVLNVTAGEGCDDGNTDPGDGCDASCQIEP